MALGILIYISEEFVKLRSATIYRVMSVFLIATTPIPLSGLTWNLMFEYFSEICGEKSRSFGIQRSCRVFYKRPKWVYRNISYIFFYVLVTVQLSIFISVINQLDAQNFCSTISLFHASKCFEHMCSSSGSQNCITQHGLLHRCTSPPPTGMVIPEAVYWNFDFLMMSTHVLETCRSMK
jgi:hypothetical protein